MLVAVVSMYPWSTVREASDVVFWVDPEHRNGRAAIALERAYAAQASSLGARDLYLGSTQSHDFERAGRFYRTLGYEKMGEAFRRIIA